MTKVVEMDTIKSNQGINDNDRHYEVWMIAQQNLRRKRGMWDKKNGACEGSCEKN